jgi:hypothetical protein
LTTAGQPTRLPHNRDPDLADILDLLLKVKAAGITLVAASGRHEHEWKLWRDRRLPEGRTLIVGVIDHTSNIIEHSEAVADRIVRWARVVGRENVIAGVDCGFDPEQKRWPARRPSLRATAAETSGYTPKLIIFSFSLLAKRYRNRHHLAPLGRTSRCSPRPSVSLYALSLGRAWRTATSVSGMAPSLLALVWG